MHEAEFNRIFKEYQNMVYSLSLRFTGNRDDALEVAQNAFMKVYKGLPNFRHSCKLSTWIYRITVNEALMYKRTMRSFSPISEIPTTDTNWDGFVGAAEYLTADERKRYVNEALQGIDPNYSAILMLYYIEEQSIDEIAEVMQQSASNIKIKLYRGRKLFAGKLTQLLKNEVKSLL